MTEQRDVTALPIDPPESPREFRGQWAVVLRDIPANEDEFLGPFHSEEKAERVARRLRRDIEARGAGRILEAFVKWLRPSMDVEEARDEMLRDLDEMGYLLPHPAPGGSFGSGSTTTKEAS